jgi:ribonuclease D
MQYRELQTKHAVFTYLKSLERNMIAVDLEGEYNLHEYGEKVCLVQIYDGRELVLIDPFSVDTSALAKLFENPRLLKVMYGASSDLSVLKNGHGIECKAILDLQPGVKLLGHTKLNLHTAVRACLGIELEDKKKFQKYNWTRRPIDAEAIAYALCDVKYLLELKDTILPQLLERGLLEQFFLENMILQHKDYTRVPGQRLRKSRRFQALSAKAKQRFEGCFEIREQYAQQLNIPPHQLLANQELLAVADNPDLFARVTYPQRLQGKLVKAFHREMAALFAKN